MRRDTRSYIVRECVESLKGIPHIAVHELWNAGTKFWRLPLFIVQVDSKTAGLKHDVLLSGGVHGDEPAGVWAVLRFLEKVAPHYLKKFRFFIYPCVNPCGYVWNTRENVEKVDLNRDFTPEPSSRENCAVVNSLWYGPSRYAFTMDFHECDPEFETEEFRKQGFTKADNPDGFWLWEHQAEHTRRVGKKIVDAVSGAGIPVCRWPKIFGDTNNSGVISYPEGRTSSLYSGAASFDVFLHQNYTDHAFTAETISDWDPKRRIQAHLIALTTILDEYAKR